MIAQLTNISKYYPNPGGDGEQSILKNLSLSVNQGESIAITGPSGSGKTTLLNILGTLDQPSCGEVHLNGTRIDSLSEQKLAELRNGFIGFVFQLHYLLPQFTLLENILLPTVPNKRKQEEGYFHERALFLAEKTGLTRRLHQRPGELSTGECQRGAMARALINTPRLLLADEPTGSLDAKNAAHLSELMLTMAREEKISLVVATHSTELAARMEKIYRLTSGQLQLITP